MWLKMGCLVEALTWPPRRSRATLRRPAAAFFSLLCGKMSAVRRGKCSRYFTLYIEVIASRGRTTTKHTYFPPKVSQSESTKKSKHEAMKVVRDAAASSRPAAPAAAAQV